MLVDSRIVSRQLGQEPDQFALPTNPGFEEDALELRAYGFPSNLVQVCRCRQGFTFEENGCEFDLRVRKAEKCPQHLGPCRRLLVGIGNKTDSAKNGPSSWLWFSIRDCFN